MTGKGKEEAWVRGRLLQGPILSCTRQQGAQTADFRAPGLASPSAGCDNYPEQAVLLAMHLTKRCTGHALTHKVHRQGTWPMTATMNNMLRRL